MSRAHALLIAAVASSAFVPAIARGDETEQCVSSHLEAQRAKRDGKLLAARNALVACSKDTCPSVLIEECGALLASVERSVPTVVFIAQDATGRDVADARVLVGAEVLAPRLEGKAVELDPGAYTFRFERAGSKLADVSIVVREGDKARRVEVRLEPADMPTTSKPISPAFWAIGSVGLAGLAIFGGLATAGYLKRQDLDESGCKPHCDSDDVDVVRGLFLGADIALGLGLAALVTAPIVYVATGSGTEVPTTTAWVSIDVTPRRGLFLVGGAF